MTGVRTKCVAEAALRHPEPVVGGGIEVAEAVHPGSVYGRARIGVRHLSVKVPQLGAAERQFGECDLGSWELPLSDGGHLHQNI